MNEQNIYNEPSNLIAELKEAAFEYLLLNPGTEFGDWQQGLISDYPTEVVDALGTNPEEVYAALADMWDAEDYEDEATGECHAFKDWAEYFATDRSVELYNLLADAKRDIKRFKALQTQNQPNPQPRAQSPTEGHF